MLQTSANCIFHWTCRPAVFPGLIKGLYEHLQLVGMSPTDPSLHAKRLTGDLPRLTETWQRRLKLLWSPNSWRSWMTWSGEPARMVAPGPLGDLWSDWCKLRVFESYWTCKSWFLWVFDLHSSSSSYFWTRLWQALVLSNNTLQLDMSKCIAFCVLFDHGPLAIWLLAGRCHMLCRCDFELIVRERSHCRPA